MSAEARQSVACPPPVEISAWTDGEGDDGVGVHVQRCGRCQRTVVTYQRLDQSVQSLISPPDGLVDSIKSACRELEAETPVRRFPLDWLLKTAASVALLGVAVLAFSSALRPSRGSSVAGGATDPKPAGEAAVTVVQAGDSETRPSSPPVVSLAPGQLRPVATQSPGLTVVGAAGTAAAGPIADAVRHVWVVDDLQRVPDQLRRACPRGVRADAHVNTDGSLAYRLVLSDTQLQTLVNDLGRRGHALVTSAAPQPGRELTVPTNRSVDYTVIFVPAR